MFGIMEAVWLALIQGVTEFLPVSSSGHLIILGQLLRLNTEAGGLILDAVLHLGTLIALCIVYAKDVWNLVKEGVLLIVDGIGWLVNKEKHPFRMYPARRLELLAIVACIPTAILGLIVKQFVEGLFMSSLIAVGIALLVTSAVLFCSKRLPNGTKNQDTMTMKDALLIGSVQGISTIPGISRSGSTIVGGQAFGLEREFAVKFSFLISVPATIGGAGLSLLTADYADVQIEIWPVLIALVLSAAVGYVCIRLLIGLFKKNKLYWFGFYTAAVGLLAVIAGFFI